MGPNEPIRNKQSENLILIFKNGRFTYQLVKIGFIDYKAQPGCAHVV